MINSSLVLQDFRGSLYLKLGLTSEQVRATLRCTDNSHSFVQVDALVGGVSEGQINYVDWLAFFTTSPICTSTDVGQFIRSSVKSLSFGLTAAVAGMVVHPALASALAS